MQLMCSKAGDGIIFAHYFPKRPSGGGRSGLVLLLRLALPLAPIPGLQRSHAELADLGISLEEGGEGVGVDDGRQLDLLLGLSGRLALAVRGADQDRQRSRRVQVWEDGCVARCGEWLVVGYLGRCSGQPCCLHM
jgi:hypothetical protein